MVQEAGPPPSLAAAWLLPHPGDNLQKLYIFGKSSNDYSILFLFWIDNSEESTKR